MKVSKDKRGKLDITLECGDENLPPWVFDSSLSGIGAAFIAGMGIGAAVCCVVLIIFGGLKC